MKKILLSVSILVFVGAIVAGATGAFFSDTETSTGNTFTAGSIDLKIDNESYVTDDNGDLVFNQDTSWILTDLIAEKFFNFIDLKPGDIGEDTISIHVGDNSAWVCAAAQITEDTDNGITEPEDEVATGPNDNNDGTADGDLDGELQFVFWVDDGDNVLEEGDEAESIFLTGTLSDMGAAGQITLADSQTSILGNAVPIPGDSEFYIGKAWCFGNLGITPTPEADTDPVTRGATGISCDGSTLGNISQTDKVVGDLQFYAEQSRNNSTFTCSGDWTPVWPS